MKFDVIVDLQFGSTGKGLFAGYMAKRNGYDTIFTAWGPNAGHTFIDESGRKFVHTMLGNGIVSPGLTRVMVGPGSVINRDSLRIEVECARDVLGDAPIYVHPNAAVVTDADREAEAKYGFKIGSTMKGTAEANIRKMRRITPSVAKDYEWFSPMILVRDHSEWIDICQEVEYGLVEGAQGYSLGIGSGLYPYVTSRECTTAQVLSDCGLPVAAQRRVYGVARTYPIRVANRYLDGQQVGTSGPGYPDQKELNWAEDLGRVPELTTVTKLPRRIFSFSEKQISDACWMNGVESVFLNFANYCEDENELREIIARIQHYAPVEYLGYGPSESDVRRIIGHLD